MIPVDLHGHQFREGTGVRLPGEPGQGDEQGGPVTNDSFAVQQPVQGGEFGVQPFPRRPSRDLDRCPRLRAHHQMGPHLHRPLGHHQADHLGPGSRRVARGNPPLPHPQRHDPRTARIAADDHAVVVRRRGRRSRGVGEARVVRVVADVLAAVVVEADQAVRTGRLEKPVGGGDRRDRVRSFRRARFLRRRPYLVVRREQQAEEALAGPVRGRGARIALQDRLVGAVPAEGQQAVRVDRPALQEVLQGTRRQPSGLPGDSGVRPVSAPSHSGAVVAKR